jgi:hypothetical protein
MVNIMISEADYDMYLRDSTDPNEIEYYCIDACDEYTKLSTGLPVGYTRQNLTGYSFRFGGSIWDVETVYEEGFVIEYLKRNNATLEDLNIVVYMLNKAFKWELKL